MCASALPWVMGEVWFFFYVMDDWVGHVCRVARSSSVALLGRFM